MNQARHGRFSLRKLTLAGIVAPFALAASGIAGAAGQDNPALTAGITPERLSDAAAAACGCLYSVINLDPEGDFAVLNAKGQAAAGNFFLGTQRFFDGERLHDLGSLGGGFTVIKGLNNRGVVTGTTSDVPGYVRAFTWTVSGGMRGLPGKPLALAYDINDKNQVVGTLQLGGGLRRAVRWDPDGRMIFLGPLPLSDSEARVINNHSLAGGHMDVRATIWDPAGQPTDLGSIGYTTHINERNEAAGWLEGDSNETERAFYWNARDGMVATGAAGFGRLVSGMNDRGEITGNTNIPGGRGAYLWSRALGLRLLPGAGTGETDAFALNNRSQIVGAIRYAGGQLRAVLWNGLKAPIDLNTRLYHPPAGLVVQAGGAINDKGDILAYSNAGLVMLRPGKRGTDAPVLGPVTGLPREVDLGQELRLTLSFVDNSPTQTHKADVKWDDGCTSPHPLVRESGGVGEVSFQHRFCRPGFTMMTVLVTDSGGRSTETRALVLANTPGLAAIGGQGTLARGTASAGARETAPRFMLWAPLGAAASAKSAEMGGSAPHFSLSGPFHFRSDQIATSAVSGQAVRLEGTGRFNGSPGYRFQIEAQGRDRMRVRITHTEPSGKEVVDYDNGADTGAAAKTSTAEDRTKVTEGGLTLST